MTRDEGPNVSQGGVEAISNTAQSMQNGKSMLGDSHPQPALNEDLMKRVLSPANLHTAWKHVLRGLRDRVDSSLVDVQAFVFGHLL